MVGRRRRTSDSTTATVDPEDNVYTDELNVLKKFDPRLEADDATSTIQTFILEDATIHDKHGQPAELFTVRTKGPFTIRGRLKIDQEQSSRAKNPAMRTALIESKNIRRYAIGAFDSENSVRYGAWAGGGTGWFEIRPPSAEYKPTHDRMIEGVAIYYTIMTAIEEHADAVEEYETQTKPGKKGSKKKGRKSPPKALTIQSLLLKYAVAMGDGATLDEVEARCDNHAPFLISHFYEDRAAFDWEPTIFFKWLVERHPDIHLEVQKARKMKPQGQPTIEEVPEEMDIVAPADTTDEPPAQKAISKRRQRDTPQDTGLNNDDVEAHNSGASGSRRSIRSRSRAKTKTQSRSPPPVVIAAVSSPPPEPMDVDAALQNMSVSEPSQNQEASERSNVDLILEGLEELRPELEPLSKNSFPKVSSKLYYKYSIKHYLGSAEILKYYARELVERLDQSVWGDSKFWDTLQENAHGPRITLEHVTVENIPGSLIRRKAKTTNTKPETNGAGSSAAFATPPPKRAGRPAGKMSALRLVGSKGSKRRFDSTEDTPDTVSRGSKAAKTSHTYDSEENSMEAASSSGDSDNESEVDTAESPAALKVVVRAEILPTTDAKGPNGTWVCDEEDCGFVVRNPDQDEGRERIQDHIQEAHYKDENRDARIDLAVTEGVKNHLPIEYGTHSPSSHFRQLCLSDEVSPFWDTGPSGPLTSRAASPSESVTVAGSSDEDDILPGTLESISCALSNYISR
ncbi:hypothetical protein GCG54_00001440 [Colletotrichum gloeosporioides]|uniref:RFTS domain-containing protein n=1 Tax=Colletotrichum gloeosporioides TaxID=474922 RepID=A0A8H4CWH4_COLGL|nr:uncharacterized protein GCG54_00001440 [Colletotrichum gloeosporioides]KAF3811126.1 hypothetical protein GCG54_00001440 [Colletotrichum gloeosporioides]